MGIQPEYISRKVRIRMKKKITAVILAAACAMFSACSSDDSSTADSGESAAPKGSGLDFKSMWASVNGSKLDDNTNGGIQTADGDSAIQFEHYPDSYKPQKTEYNFYFTYKMIHPWWDAVSLGMENAVQKYKDIGINISYDYVAPAEMSALDQRKRLKEAAASGEYDVIGVDVDDKKIISPVIGELTEAGNKIMTFASSDCAVDDSDCKRIAYVGNTHNYRDGADLTEALCEKLNYKGKVVLLIGSQGGSSYEDRAKSAREVINKYPDMEIIDSAYDECNADIAYEYTLGFLNKYPDISGIICCNMSGPVGAARAVTESAKTGDITIVGMDHDKQALEYLKNGTIYCLGVQDCFSMGFDTIQTAIKIADGLLPGDDYKECTDEKTTIIYKDDAKYMLRVLYGEID